MTENQKAVLLDLAVRAAVAWREMTTSPAATVRDAARKTFAEIGERVWGFVRGLAEGTPLEFEEVPGFPADLLAGAFLRAAIRAENGRILGVGTRYKNDAGAWRFVRIIGENPEADATPLPVGTHDGKPARPRKDYGPAILWANDRHSVAGTEYTITVGTKHDTSKGIQDPEARLDRDEDAGVVTLWSPDRRKKTRDARDRDVVFHRDLRDRLLAVGGTPTEKHVLRCVRAADEPGDGCRCVNVRDVSSLAFSGLRFPIRVG